ncbi:MAG: SIS domain-containing protein, partial [Edaphobacter sp.]
MKDLVKKQLAQSIATMQAVLDDPHIADILISIGELTAKAMQDGHKLLVAGNGGSAADAQHLVAEFVVRLTVNRPALRAIALTTDSSILTATGNDFGFDRIFERQVEALGQPGDVFLGISTSGNSPNILKALQQAKEMGIATIGFSGNGG